MKAEINICDDNLKSKSILKEEKVQGEEKPFKCALCDTYQLYTKTKVDYM